MKHEHKDRKEKPVTSEGGELDPNVGALVNYFNTSTPTDPDPAPGIVREATGENEYTVDYTTSDLFIHTVEHVGFVVPEEEPPSQYIEIREGGPIEP